MTSTPTSDRGRLGLRGLVAAPHTPLTATGELALDRVAEQARCLREDGVIGVFVGGTTGEWASLTVAERQRLLEAWAPHRTELRLIAHVGHHCQRDAIALARHAGQLGAHAVSALLPSFFRPSDAAEVAAFQADIAAAAPELPFYGYHIPGMTGVTVPVVEQIAACLERIPSFAGLKFTDPDLHAFAACRRAFGAQCELIWGVDELLLSALPLGVQAAVGSTYNYAAPVYLRLLGAFERGDVAAARSEARTVTALVDALLAFGVLRAGKALMTLRGVDCGPPRPPVSPLRPAARRELFEQVRTLGLFAAGAAAPDRGAERRADTAG
ncbi:MAG: dihydrodipicolinate synthase family protein [Planctomycetes bacterium]|nr:dihydrodipicolinate synthase family protein [Planctomycetota bacterium]